MKALGILCATLAVVTTAAFAQESLEAKLDELLARHADGAEAPKDFDIEETEANDYLRGEGSAQLPDGVESPWVKFEESLAVVGATLDLDKLQGELPDSMIFQLLTGRVPVEVTARVVGDAGIGKLDIERVILGGVELPPDMVAALVEGKDTSAFLPPGFQLGQAFVLPYNVETIRCEPGTVRVRQGAVAADK